MIQLKDMNEILSTKQPIRLVYPTGESNIANIWEFKNEEDWRCKSEAKNFLWRFLCNGIHISYTHPWLLKDFYDIMKSLENVINEYKEGISVAKRHITGNYEGTEIKIEISK